MPPEFKEIDYNQNPQLRKELAEGLAKAFNNALRTAPFELTGFKPITQEDIENTLSNQEQMDKHLRAKALYDRVIKQNKILKEYNAENEKLPLHERWIKPATATILYTFLDPSGTKEAKEKNDALIERIRKEGDSFLIKKAFDDIADFNYEELFNTDESKQFETYEKYQDKLNVMFAINRNLANGHLLEVLPKEMLDVYEKNLKIIESASNITSKIEAYASPYYPLIPENTNISPTAASLSGKDIHEFFKPYNEKGYNFKDPGNFLALYCSIKDNNAESNKIMDALGDIKPKNILNLTAKKYNPNTKEYESINTYEGLVAHSNGEQVIFTEDTDATKIFKETEIPNRFEEERARAIKEALFSVEHNKAENAKYSELLTKLKATHTWLSGTRFSTDSTQFDNLEDALEKFVNITGQIDKTTFAGDYKEDNKKAYIDAYKNLEQAAEKYYTAKLSQSKNDRRQKRFDIAEEIFKSMDSRQIEEAVKGPSKATLAHRQHISVMEASDITNSGKKDIIKAVQQLNKGFDKKGPENVGPKK